MQIIIIISFFLFLFLTCCSGQENDIQVNTRIIGGRRARENEYPNYVLIRMKSDGGVCGGTLIDVHIVLTAAHCLVENKAKEMFRDHKDLEIFIGSNDLNSKNMYRTEAVQVILHPNYHPSKNKENDIALIRLKSAFNVNQLKAMIPPTNKSSIFVGKKVWTVGFGTTDPDKQALSDHLQTVNLDILPDNVCEQLFTSNKDKFNPNLMICAGDLNGGKDTCNGDAGSPLILKSGEEDGETASQIILGITSYGKRGSKCGSKDSAAVYTKVASYKKWIHDVLEGYIAHAIK